MKKYTYIALVLAASTAGVFAQDVESAAGKHEARRAKMMERFDTDKDGQLSESERAAMRTELGDKGGRRGDAKGGCEAEGKADGPKHRLSPELRQKMLEKFDADGDGQLNEAERNAMRAQRKPAPPADEA